MIRPLGLLDLSDHGEIFFFFLSSFPSFLPSLFVSSSFFDSLFPFLSLILSFLLSFFLSFLSFFLSSFFLSFFFFLFFFFLFVVFHLFIAQLHFFRVSCPVAVLGKTDLLNVFACYVRSKRTSCGRKNKAWEYVILCFQTKMTLKKSFTRGEMMY